METKYLLSLTIATFALALSTQTAHSIPVLKQLPSITTDTINDDPFEPDAAESVGPVGAIAAFSTLGQLRGMYRLLTGEPKQEASHGIRYYMSPMGIARSMGSLGMSMGSMGLSAAKSFYDTFNQQYQESLKNLQETTIPQAASLMGVWQNAPETTQNQWMSGI